MKTVFFDLDGTITDSAPGILASVRYALEKYRTSTSTHCTASDLTSPTSVASDTSLNFFIGPPLIDSFQKYLACSHSDALQCLAWYRQFYTGASDVQPSTFNLQPSHLPGMLMNSVYPGVVETLVRLRESGVKIVLATAKPEVYARQILEHFDLAKYFDFIHGATLDEGRNKKAQVIAWALTHSGDIGEVVMVGDRADDILGAKANDIPVIGALWGYGSEEELRTAGASVFAETINEVFKLIQGGNT